MNLSGKGPSSDDKKHSSTKPTLNPNAAEFVPFSLRSPVANISTSTTSPKFSTSNTAGSPGKAILDRSESSNSEEEAQRYWHNQLPDDITPDFNILGIDDTQGIENLSFSSLSLTDTNQGSRYTASTGRASSYGDYTSPRDFQPSLVNPWDKQIVRNDQFLAREELPPYNGNSRHGYLGGMSSEQLLMDNFDVGPLEILASQFPGFAAESLAEVYFANGRDLNLTVEMLTQLELQVDEGLNQTLNSKANSTPNLSPLDFPALSARDGQNGFSDDHLQQNVSPYRSAGKESNLLFRSSSIPSRGAATDFASAVRKMASRDSSIWNFDRSGSSETSTGSSRGSQVLARSYSSGQDRGVYGNRMQDRGSTHASPVWLETGEAVANMYSEVREEARDHARIRNVYFEQARQAYLVGNKALAKELSIKGQLHNMRMKAAHGKAQESIYRQRSTVESGMIDLHGLHVSEAIHVLKRELAVMKNAARSADQRLLAYICVGTGHHTRGSRTPARLPTAVQHYLLEEEALDYTEPQPGLLCVVI